MGFIANMGKAVALTGQSVGDGGGLAYIQAVAFVPPPAIWAAGAAVKDNLALLPGTVIATFNTQGWYGSPVAGSTQCAVYVRQNALGLVVLDQAPGRTAALRLVRYVAGQGPAMNNGNMFYVVEVNRG